MAENNFNNTVSSLFQGMENFITTKTVVGDAITVGDTILLPLVDVSFGVCASARAEDRKNSGGGGMGGKMSPSAILVIRDGSIRLINVRNQDSVNKLLDMVPDVVERFASGFGRAKTDEEVDEAIHSASEAGDTVF